MMKTNKAEQKNQTGKTHTPKIQIQIGNYINKTERRKPTTTKKIMKNKKRERKKTYKIKKNTGNKKRKKLK